MSEKNNLEVEAERMVQKAIDMMSEALSGDDFVKATSAFRNAAAGLANLRGEVSTDFDSQLSAFQEEAEKFQQRLEKNDEEE